MEMCQLPWLILSLKGFVDIMSGDVITAQLGENVNKVEHRKEKRKDGFYYVCNSETSKEQILVKNIHVLVFWMFRWDFFSSILALNRHRRPCHPYIFWIGYVQQFNVNINGKYEFWNSYFKGFFYIFHKKVYESL